MDLPESETWRFHEEEVTEKLGAYKTANGKFGRERGYLGIFLNTTLREQGYAREQLACAAAAATSQGSRK